MKVLYSEDLHLFIVSFLLNKDSKNLILVWQSKSLDEQTCKYDV